MKIVRDKNKPNTVSISKDGITRHYPVTWTTPVLGTNFVPEVNLDNVQLNSNITVTSFGDEDVFSVIDIAIPDLDVILVGTRDLNTGRFVFTSNMPDNDLQ